MYEQSKVMLRKQFWDESADRQELKQKISKYMSASYPGYKVLEIHKYYCVCEIVR